MKKWILRIAVAFFALVLIGLVAVYLSLNGLVRSGVERGATEATGQKTSVGSASVSVFGGTLELSGVEVENPAGYSGGKMVVMKACKATAEMGSLLTNDVVVPEIDIEGMVVTVEQKGLGTNLSEALKVSEATTPAAGGAGAATPPGRNIHVGVIKLTGTVVRLSGLGQSVPLELGPIEIKDPTNPDGRPMKVADVAAKVLVKVAEQIANDPRIPEGVKAGINEATAMVGNVTKAVQEESKGIGAGIGGLFKKK